MTPEGPDARLRALLFDLDGTLADTAAVNVQAYREALAEAGVPVAAGVLERESPGRNWRQFLPPIIDAAGSTADPARIAERKKALYRGLVPLVRLNDALLALLTACHGPMQTALVTTASRANVDSLLEAHGLRRHFDCVVTGDDVARHKPDPEAYRLAAARLGVPPGQCLAFEDSDIGEASARAAGVRCVRIAFAASRPSVSTRPAVKEGNRGPPGPTLPACQEPPP